MMSTKRSEIILCVFLVIAGCSQSVLNEKDDRYLQFVKPLPSKDQDNALQMMPESPVLAKQSMSAPATSNLSRAPASMKEPLSKTAILNMPEAPTSTKKLMSIPFISNTSLTKQKVPLPVTPVKPNLAAKPVSSSTPWPPTSGPLTPNTSSTDTFPGEPISALPDNTTTPGIKPIDEPAFPPEQEVHLDMHVNGSLSPNPLPLPPNVRKAVHKINKQLRQLHLENQKVKVTIIKNQQEMIKQLVSLRHIQANHAPKNTSNHSTLVKMTDIYLTFYICGSTAISTAFLIMLVLMCSKLLPSSSSQ